MNTKFITQIHNLQQNNFVILRDMRSETDKKLLAQLTRGYTRIDLSLPIICSLAKRDAQGFAAQLKESAHSGAVYLENLQYAPQLLPLLAQSELPASSVIASCTQSFALAKLSTNLPNVRLVELPLSEGCLDNLSLATNSQQGQAVDEVVADGSLREELFTPFTLEANYLQVLAKRQPVDVLTAIWQGARSAYGGDYGEYLQKVVQADIMFLTTVSSSEKFYCFMQAAAAQVGNIVNYVKLAQAASITPPTAKTWLNFLLGTGIVYLLEPVQNIGLKRLVSTKKLYFRDTGLACYLLGVEGAESLAKSEYLANLEQNYMLNKIRESYINVCLTPSIRFYRDNNKKNIDVILRQGNVLQPMLLATDKMDAERVRFAFDVLTDYAARRGFTLGAGAIIYPACVTQEVLPNLWQVSAEILA